MKDLDKRELGTVLAALKTWQAGDFVRDDSMIGIATDDGEMERLDDDEIEALCERLNGPGDMRPFLFDASLNNAKAAAQMCLAKLQEAMRYAGPLESLLLVPTIESAADLEGMLDVILDATRSAS